MDLLPVRAHIQSPGDCGPRALESVLTYFGRSVPLRTIRVLCKTTRARGTTPENLVRAARALGFHPLVIEWAELHDLADAVRKRLPPLVLWFSENEGHYSAVAGINRRFVYLADPEIGAVRRLPAETFRRVWFDFSTNGPEKRSRLYARWMMMLEPRETPRRTSGPGRARRRQR